MKLLKRISRRFKRRAHELPDTPPPVKGRIIRVGYLDSQGFPQGWVFGPHTAPDEYDEQGRPTIVGGYTMPELLEIEQKDNIYVWGIRD